jgi:S1-C subfamily serine protease
MVKLTPCLAAVIFGIAPTLTVLQTHSIVAQSASQPNVSVASIARQVTVQIVQTEGLNTGSGVVIAHQGQTYHVLTANHVVATQGEYDIVTPDGKKHRAHEKLVRKLPRVDLALVQFTSSQTYQVAMMGRSHQLSTGTPAYVAGFPLKVLGTSQTEF